MQTLDEKSLALEKANAAAAAAAAAAEHAASTRTSSPATAPAPYPYSDDARSHHVHDIADTAPFLFSESGDRRLESGATVEIETQERREAAMAQVREVEGVRRRV